MKTLNQHEQKSIEQLFQLTQDQLLKVMRQYLSTRYKHVRVSDKYLVAFGDIPVALIAHLDTVFKLPPDDIYYDRVKNVMWSPDGLGADDRAGVFAIIQILKSGLRPTIILTTDEEKGCIGATALASANMSNAIQDLKYVIQLDRRGADDCVFYSCDNKKFNEYVESFGFVTNFGSYSDISVICPAWKIAGVNLSVGYYNEHSVSETLHIGQLFNTIRKVKKMLRNAKDAPQFEYVKSASAYAFEKLYGAYDEKDLVDWDPAYGISKEDWIAFMSPRKVCGSCGVEEFEYELFPTKTPGGGTVLLCSDCAANENTVHWCTICGEPFISTEDRSYCDDCRGVMNIGNN